MGYKPLFSRYFLFIHMHVACIVSRDQSSGGLVDGIVKKILRLANVASATATTTASCSSL